MSFERIRGQEAAVALLRRALRSERIAPVYLFFGPEGVGKASAAESFARALLCPEGRDRQDACGRCPACLRSAAGTHAGLLRVERGTGRTEVVLKQIQDLAEALSLRPTEGERTVALLPEGQHVNEEGWNALLKLLEEPPPGTTFVIGTDNREAVPETVRSRCQTIRFAPLREDVLIAILTGESRLSEEEARAAAPLAGGSAGRALRLAEAGLPARLPRIVELLSTEKDPVAVNEAVFAEAPAGGDRREPLSAARARAEDIVRMVAEAIRRRFLGGGRPDTAGAGFCLDAVARALDNLRLNLAPDAVLVTLWTEILPRWQTPRPS